MGTVMGSQDLEKSSISCTLGLLYSAKLETQGNVSLRSSFIVLYTYTFDRGYEMESAQVA